jgi:hypothetical protein
VPSFESANAFGAPASFIAQRTDPSGASAVSESSCSGAGLPIVT